VAQGRDPEVVPSQIDAAQIARAHRSVLAAVAADAAVAAVAIAAAVAADEEAVLARAPGQRDDHHERMHPPHASIVQQTRCRREMCEITHRAPRHT